MRGRRLLAIGLAILTNLDLATADTAGPIGIVVMHGKGESPSASVAGLAGALQAEGYFVANLEMPWSARRNYDVDVGDADAEVTAALQGLRQQGAKSVFISGHDHGGAVALHYGTRCGCDGIIAIAPSGVVSGMGGRVLFAKYLARARQLVAEGKGGEKSPFIDHQGTRGTYALLATPLNYLDWFKPDGPMNLAKGIRAWKPEVPVLWVTPTRDYATLRNKAEQQYRQLPANPLSRFYRPDSDHGGAPVASAHENVRWTRAIAAATTRNLPTVLR